MKHAKTPSRLPDLQKLHPMHSLGNVPVSEGEIRVERIENRLKPKVPFPHKHDFYHFLFLEIGSGWHEIDFVRFAVKAPQLYLMKPGEVHSWDLGPRTRGFVLEFTKSSFGRSEQSAHLLAGLDRTPSVISGAALARMETILQLMQEEFTCRRPGYRAALEHLLLALLVQIERASAASEPKAARPSSLMEKFRELVEKNFHREHSVEFYADSLGTTVKNLTTQAARAVGKSAGAVIQDRCVLEAKRLLAYSDRPVSEIGYSLGFEDPNYFARFFKQRAGVTPGKFRQRAAQVVAL
jgi:AraC-like DNA-binding protein